MDVSFLYKGIILGIFVSAPVGPIGILCINRTLKKGYVSGLVSGLGATTADFFFGLIVGLGINIVSGFLMAYQNWIHAIGVIFLFFVGFKTILKKQIAPDLILPESKGLFKDYLTTFFLTLTNPLTIFFFIAVFAGLGVSNIETMQAIPLLLGVLVGSGGWWFILCGFTSKFKKNLGWGVLKRIDLISGFAILCFALVIAIKLIMKFV